MIYVKINNVSKVFKEKKVFNNVDLILNQGFYLLTGENGAGKTTFLKLIKGLTKTSSGNIYISNEINYIPDKVSFPQNIKVEKLFKLFKEYYNSNIDLKDIYNFLNLEEYRFKKIKELSKGTKHKVLIGISLFKKADIYLFDEPLDGLENVTIKWFLSYIKELIDSNKLVIIASHNITYYENFKKQILKIEKGKIIYV